MAAIALSTGLAPQAILDAEADVQAAMIDLWVEQGENAQEREMRQNMRNKLQRWHG